MQYLQKTSVLAQRFLAEAQALQAEGANGADWLCFELGLRCASFDAIKCPTHMNFEAMCLAGRRYLRTSWDQRLPDLDPTIPALVQAVKLFDDPKLSNGGHV